MYTLTIILTLFQLAYAIFSYEGLARLDTSEAAFSLKLDSPQIISQRIQDAIDILKQFKTNITSTSKGFLEMSNTAASKLHKLLINQRLTDLEEKALTLTLQTIHSAFSQKHTKWSILELPLAILGLYNSYQTQTTHRDIECLTINQKAIVQAASIQNNIIKHNAAMLETLTSLQLENTEMLDEADSMHDSINKIIVEGNNYIQGFNALLLHNLSPTFITHPVKLHIKDMQKKLTSQGLTFAANPMQQLLQNKIDFAAAANSFHIFVRLFIVHNDVKP